MAMFVFFTRTTRAWVVATNLVAFANKRFSLVFTFCSWRIIVAQCRVSIFVLELSACELSFSFETATFFFFFDFFFAADTNMAQNTNGVVFNVP